MKTDKLLTKKMTADIRKYQAPGCNSEVQSMNPSLVSYMSCLIWYLPKYNQWSG